MFRFLIGNLRPDGDSNDDSTSNLHQLRVSWWTMKTVWVCTIIGDSTADGSRVWCVVRPLTMCCGGDRNGVYAMWLVVGGWWGLDTGVGEQGRPRMSLREHTHVVLPVMGDYTET
jgi:hypothetical protein